MSDSKTIAALEIGTGKMQVFIGEIVDNKCSILSESDRRPPTA